MGILNQIHFVCYNLLLVIPFERLMLICALPWLSALCCPVLLLCFCFLSWKPHFFVCMYIFISPSCLSLSALGFDCKKTTQNKNKNKKQNNQYQTLGPINLHHWMSLSSLMTCSLLPPPSLACCDWWLRCLAWAVLCGRNSSPKYGLLADRYHFCEKCFNEIQGESVSLGDDPSQPQTWVIVSSLIIFNSQKL